MTRRMHHAHESPWVMLIPLIVLAIGAAFFGWLGYDYFIGDASAEFWKSAILVLPAHDALAKAEAIPALIAYLPLICGIAGIAVAYVVLHRQSAAAGAARPALPRTLPVPAQQVVFRRTLRLVVRPSGDGDRRRVVEDRATAR